VIGHYKLRSDSIINITGRFHSIPCTILRGSIDCRECNTLILKQKYLMSYSDLKFGVFLAPAHARIDDPSGALENPLQRIQKLDELGYDYAWLLEDQSPETLISGSSEAFIATAIGRTKTIKLGVSVTSPALQHPLMLADRLAKLSRLAKGRITFCIGLDELPAETTVNNSSSTDQRDGVLESLNVLLPLLREQAASVETSVETSAKTSNVELAIASQISPGAAQIAGTHGLGLVTVSATSAGGFDTLAINWEIGERAAKTSQQTVDRKNWSLVGPVHIAKTRAQAFRDVTFGLGEWVAYFREVADLQVVPDGIHDPALWLVNNGLAVIGTPFDAIAQIRRLQEQSGGFGCFLQMGHNWADRGPSKKSIELFARHVIPEFQSRRDPIHD
jgi:limonene 1,2-monooxygenase